MKLWNFEKKNILICLGYEEAAKLLIRKGADVNIVGQDDNTALIVGTVKTVASGNNWITVKII